MENMDKRSFTTEVRVSEGDNPVISGLAALFNKRTELWPEHFEEIKPGAFDGVLKTDDVRALFNHNSDNILGRISAGTLRLKADKRGLHYEYDQPDTQAGRDTTTSIKRGDVTGSSFSFNVAEDELKSINGGVLRTIIKFASLGDVGPVTFPAYETTTVSARSKDRFAEFENDENEQQEALDGEAEEIQIEADARERELAMAERG